MSSLWWETVHPDDKWLLRESDVQWLQKMGPDGIRGLSDNDDKYRGGLFLSLMEDGKTPEQAAAEVKKTFPMYYVDPSDREFPGMSSLEDAHLPFALKHRLGLFKLIGLKRFGPSKYTSFNACVREVCRRGKL